MRNSVSPIVLSISALEILLLAFALLQKHMTIYIGGVLSEGYAKNDKESPPPTVLSFFLPLYSVFRRLVLVLEFQCLTLLFKLYGVSQIMYKSSSIAMERCINQTNISSLSLEIG